MAHRTAATPLLLNAVRARARRSSCSFTLLVPRPYWDPDTEQAAATLELAIPLLEEAVGGHINGIIGDTDPFVAVRETVASIGIDEIIVSTLPARVSHWLRQDLPHRVRAIRVAGHSRDCPAIRAPGVRPRLSGLPSSELGTRLRNTGRRRSRHPAACAYE